MRLEVQAIIEGGFIINSPVTVKLHPYDLLIFQENNTYFISISKKVADYEKYMTKCIYDNGIPTISLTKYEIYKDIIELLQYIESSGSFNIDIKKIGWDEPQITWIPEIKEERGIMPLLSHQRNKDKSKKPKLLRSQSLMNILMYRKMLRENHIPFTYYKQAKNLFEEQSYYFAYINYFMMLEYCFGNGKFKKDALLKAFKSSGLLMKSVKTAFELLNKKGSDNNRKWLREECKRRNKNYDENSLIDIFVEYRGIISHACKKSEKYLYNDRELFSITFILSLVCFLVCGNLQISKFMSEEQRGKWVGEYL